MPASHQRQYFLCFAAAIALALGLGVVVWSSRDIRVVRNSEHQFTPTAPHPTASHDGENSVSATLSPPITIPTDHKVFAIRMDKVEFAKTPVSRGDIVSVFSSVDGVDLALVASHATVFSVFDQPILNCRGPGPMLDRDAVIVGVLLSNTQAKAVAKAQQIGVVRIAAVAQPSID